MRQARPVTYRYNPYVFGKTREDLENAAWAEAEEYFGTTELNFLDADVSTEKTEAGDQTYAGAFYFEVKTAV
jgi:hypothetical protein